MPSTFSDKVLYGRIPEILADSILCFIRNKIKIIIFKNPTKKTPKFHMIYEKIQLGFLRMANLGSKRFA